MIVEIMERRFVKLNTLMLQQVKAAGKDFKHLIVDQKENEFIFVFRKEPNTDSEGDIKFVIRGGGGSAVEFYKFQYVYGDLDAEERKWVSQHVYIGLFS